MSLRTLIVMMVGMALAAPAWALDQANPKDLPANHPPIGSAGPARNAEAEKIRQQDRQAFMAGIHLDELRRLSIHHADQIKILDSWARQSLAEITHRQKYQGQDPLYTALDMAFRPEAWEGQNILHVRDVPLRQQLAMVIADTAEQQRFMKQGTMSLTFFLQPDVQMLLNQLMQDPMLNQSVNRLLNSVEALMSLGPSLRIVPPAAGGDGVWHQPIELVGNLPREALANQPASFASSPTIPGYSAAAAARVLQGMEALSMGWRTNDVDMANSGIAMLRISLPAINPGAVRPDFASSLELWYNRTFNGTLVAFVYFLAMVFFVIAAIGASPRLWRPAVGLYLVAVLCHVVAMGTRWYLAGRIPIQNQFESVLGAALMGCVIGLALELWKKKSLFGMAMSFVGFLAMTACFVFPFVVGKDIGASIGPVAGILSHNYWLYIHVNIVIASYALIAGSFVLGAIYLGTVLWHWINPLAAEAAMPTVALAGGGGLMGGNAAGVGSSPREIQERSRRRRLLEQIDAANVIVLQMAFWMLGVGIICGAVWADVSWGRPWGWDPKETFALVTWIVYLLIVHLRFVVPGNRAAWTAALSIIGFGIMLFNWIGVNFFLVGLHSYA